MAEEIGVCVCVGGAVCVFYILGLEPDPGGFCLQLQSSPIIASVPVP